MEETLRRLPRVKRRPLALAVLLQGKAIPPARPSTLPPAHSSYSAMCTAATSPFPFLHAFPTSLTCSSLTVPSAPLLLHFYFPLFLAPHPLGHILSLLTCSRLRRVSSGNSLTASAPLPLNPPPPSS